MPHDDSATLPIIPPQLLVPDGEGVWIYGVCHILLESDGR